jgi:hypothetical protein
MLVTCFQLLNGIKNNATQVKKFRPLSLSYYFFEVII